MKYRVVLKVSYYERWFEFDNINKAANFAADLLRYNVPNEDHGDKMTEVKMYVVDAEAEAEAKNEEE